MVGVEIPDHLHQCITLSSLHLGTSKSQIIRDAIMKWTEQNSITLDSVLQEVIESKKAQWARRKLQVRNEDLDALYTQFIKEQRMVLFNLKINDELIHKILKAIKK